MHCITKRFGALAANNCVDLSVAKGAMHAIVGENGAGKTTLMRVLYGLYRADGGSVKIDGIDVQFQTPQDALRAGIGMVSQHYAIIPELTCLDNLILGAEGSFVIPRADAMNKAKTLAAQLGFEFDWNAEALTLTPAACQKLEILKLLWRGAKIMILDEPTAMLSPEDADMLFSNLKRLASEGKTILLVTHRLAEVFPNCSRVTVMRAGKNVAEEDVSNINAAKLAEWIVGESLDVKPGHASAIGEPRLAVAELSVQGERGNIAVDNCSFTVRKGEILGIAGVDGSGQRELVHALFGLRNYSGAVSIDGEQMDTKSPAQRLDFGMRLIPEDRRAEGVILDWPLQENAILGLQRSKAIANGPVIDRKKEGSVGVAVLERFGTKSEGLKSTMASLSGGNQQRFVAGRALYGEPRVLIAFQPTRGLDIRGAIDVFDGIRNQCAKGLAALVISFDLDELLDNCDRILVMFSGTIKELPPELAKDRHAIGRMMVGMAP